MCLIVECPAGRVLPLAVWENFSHRNDDGAGFVWTNRHGVKSARLFGGKENTDPHAIFALHKSLAADKVPHYVHLRFATHGTISKENVHPFRVVDGLYLMHNGVIGNSYDNWWDYGEEDWAYYSAKMQGKTLPAAKSTPKDNRSDTAQYIDTVLAPALAKRTDLPEYIRSTEFQTFMDSTVGMGNRVLLHDMQGAVLFQENTWHRITKEELKDAEDVLVSNTYAWDDEKPKAKVFYPTYSKSAHRETTDADMEEINKRLAAACKVGSYEYEGEKQQVSKMYEEENYVDAMITWWADLTSTELLHEIREDPEVAVRIVEELLSRVL